MSEISELPCSVKSDHPKSNDSPVTLRELRWPRGNDAASEAAFCEINRLLDLKWKNLCGVERDGDEWVCWIVSPPNVRVLEFSDPQREAISDGLMRGKAAAIPLE